MFRKKINEILKDGTVEKSKVNLQHVRKLKSISSQREQRTASSTSAYTWSSEQKSAKTENKTKEKVSKIEWRQVESENLVKIL